MTTWTPVRRRHCRRRRASGRERRRNRPAARTRPAVRTTPSLRYGGVSLHVAVAVRASGIWPALGDRAGCSALSVVTGRLTDHQAVAIVLIVLEYSVALLSASHEETGFCNGGWFGGLPRAVRSPAVCTGAHCSCHCVTICPILCYCFTLVYDCVRILRNYVYLLVLIIFKNHREPNLHFRPSISTAIYVVVRHLAAVLSVVFTVSAARWTTWTPVCWR